MGFGPPRLTRVKTKGAQKWSINLARPSRHETVGQAPPASSARGARSSEKYPPLAARARWKINAEITVKNDDF